MVHLRSVYLGVATFLLGTSLAAPAPRPLPHNPASGDIVDLAARSPLFGSKKDYVFPPSPAQLSNAKHHDQAAADNLLAFKSSTAVANAHRRVAGQFQQHSSSNVHHLDNAALWDKTAATHRREAQHHHITAESSRAGITNIHSPDIAKMSSYGAIAHHKKAQLEHARLNTVFPPPKSHRPAAASQSKNLFSKAGKLARTAWRAVTPSKHK